VNFDIVLPAVVFVIVALAATAYPGFEKRSTDVFRGRKLTVREIIIYIAIMGAMVTVIAFVPAFAIQVVFVGAYAYMLFTFVYILLRKWHIALILPAVFILSYVLYPTPLVLNIFAATFAIIASVFMGIVFSWKTTMIFAALIVVMDVVQVFGTGFMLEAAQKMVDLKLPVAVQLPTYPFERGILLGLGDVFLSGLMAIQTALRRGHKAGLVIAAAISIALFVFEIFAFNGLFGNIRGFPATVVVVLGWLMGMGILRFTKVAGVGTKSIPSGCISTSVGEA